jgi:hypothetical protein
MLLISFLINKKRTGNTSVNLMHTDWFLRTCITSSILYRFNQNLKTAFKFRFKKSHLSYLSFRFSLLLKQWQISKQINSLIEVHYAQIKRNPE